VPGTQASINLRIKELLIPLLQTTQYLHDVKLEYQNGQHVCRERCADRHHRRPRTGPGERAVRSQWHYHQPAHRDGRLRIPRRRTGRAFLRSDLMGIEYVVQNVFSATIRIAP
jgi:hypothetical protein